MFEEKQSKLKNEKNCKAKNYVDQTKKIIFCFICSMSKLKLVQK